MRILFLHGWQSTPGGLKPTYLKNHGHEVLNPALPDDDFDAAVRIAQSEYDQGQPDAVVGSSRGAAVAMNIDSKKTPLVLLCPAWKNWGTAKTVKPNTVILHSPNDDVVPFCAAVVERFPDRVLWGTDWPHPNMKSHMPDDGALVDFIPKFARTPEQQQKLLVDNPMRLYWAR